MKKVFSIMAITCLLFSMLSVSALQAAAAGELTINGKAKAKKGDKVKYTLYLADTVDEIEGFEMNVNFDPDYLSTDSDSIKFPNIENVFKNVVKGEIFINWTNVFDKLNFSEKKEFLDIEFTVLKDGETDITKFVKEIYGDDMTYLKSYTWTYSLKINDNEVIKNDPPLITDDKNLISSYQGAYINYLDGKGEENSPLGDRHEAVTAPNNSLLQNRDATQQNRVGETYLVDGEGGTYVQDVTRFVDKENKGGGFPVWIIGVISIVVIAGLIVTAVVISKKNGKNKQ